MAKKQKIRMKKERIWGDSPFDLWSLEGDLDSLIKTLQDYRNKYNQYEEIDIKVNIEYDNETSFEFHGLRLETKEEIEERLKNSKKAKEAQKKRREKEKIKKEEKELKELKKLINLSISSYSSRKISR